VHIGRWDSPRPVSRATAHTKDGRLADRRQRGMEESPMVLALTRRSPVREISSWTATPGYGPRDVTP
jgi:hypothetical protein